MKWFSVTVFLGMCSVMPRLLDSPCLVGGRRRAEAPILQGGGGFGHAPARQVHTGDCAVRSAPARRVSFDVGDLPTPGIKFVFL